MRFLPALLVLAACGSAARPPATPPSTEGKHVDQVAAQVQAYLDGEILTGVVVALIDGDQVETYGFGRVRDGEAAVPDANTPFEIGSVTKVFTALLAGDAMARGDVALDTPISQLLPFGINLPSKDGVPILVGHLVTHTAGLPPVPPSLIPRVADEDPYKGYTTEALYDDLGQVALLAAPGEGFTYSNFGYAVLGQALARKANAEWAALVAERLLRPLRLSSTFAVLAPEARATLAQGHDSDLKPVPAWTLGAMAPAGAITSTAGDLTAFLRANLAARAAKKPDALGALLVRGQEVIVEGTGATRALAWFVDERGRRWHNGGTGGHHAFVSFDPERRQGVVVLAATATSLVDRLGEAMLAVLAGEPPEPVRFPDAAALAPLAGTYDLQGTPVTVTVAGRRLYAQSPGDKPSRLVPLSATEFLIEEAEAVIAFEVEGGKAARLALLLGGEKLLAERTDTPAPAAPAP